MSNMPSFVEFELTNHCQLECIMCPHRFMTRPKGFMEFDLLKKICDEVKGYANDSYLHMQGEPLLHPNLIDCINYVSQSGLRTSFATNSLLLTKEMVHKLADSRLNEIILSIDSLDKSTYEKIRVNSSFELVLNNIKYFLKNKKNIRAIVCLTKMHENENDWNTFNIEGATEVWTKGYSTFAGAVVKGENVPSMKPNCNKQQTHLTVQWNGDVVKCCRDYDGISKYGNLYKQSVAEVWKDRETDVNKIRLCDKC